MHFRWNGRKFLFSYTGVPESTLEKIQTDSSGQTETIELAAPPEEWSLDIEEDRQPYSEYTLSIKAPGFEPVNIAGTEILANVKAIQNIQMKPADQSGEENQVFVIPAHTLYGDYPPKIAEAREQTGDGDRGDCFKPCGCAGVYRGT